MGNYSKQREEIINILKESYSHPTAEEVYLLAKEKNPSISRGTVYRNLNQLAELGVIKKIDGLEPIAHYDHNTYEHYHFICDKCKKVYDISSEIAPDVKNLTENKTGHKIMGHDITFHGKCKECQNTKGDIK